MEWGGAFSVSAQTPGSVTIRERIEVLRPAPAAPGATPARPADDPCAGGPVAYAVFRGDRYNFNGTFQAAPQTEGAPLAGTLSVTGPCGTVAGDLAAGFRLQSQTPDPPRYTYQAEGEILRYPLSPTAPIPTLVEATIAGQTLGTPFHFGCPYPDARACDRQPPALVRADIGFTYEVVGQASGRAHAWPDTVQCGTTTPLPFTLTKADGTEGWVGPGTTYTYRLPAGASPTRGTLAYEGVTGSQFPTVPYGDARAGAVTYVAPACAAITQPSGANIWVEGVLTDFIAVVTPPPVGFRLAPDPDTLGAGQTAWFAVVAVSAAGTESYLDPATPVTMTASDATLGVVSAGEGSATRTGATITVPYRTVRGSALFYAFASNGERLTRDTPVTITATGGGLSGTGKVTLLGPLRLDLTASPDSIAVGGRSALSARIAGDRAWDFPETATLTFTLDSPSMGTLRRTSTASSGTTLSGVPRAEAAGGGIEFVAVARQAPPVLARSDSTDADSVRAGARITATVDGRADLTDTAVVSVGGRSGLRLSLDCDASGRCTVSLDAPDLTACGRAYPDVVLTVRGVGGRFEFGGQTVPVGPDGGSVTVPYETVASGDVTFVVAQTCQLNGATMQAGFAAPVYDCDGEPVLSGDVTFPVTTVGAEAPACRLTLVAVPDTVRAGEEVRFTATAPGLDPGAIVTLSVSDLTLGGFVVGAPVARGAAANGASVQRIRSVTSPLGSIGDVRFLAADDVGSTSVVTVTARADRRVGTADVTIISPTPQLKLLSANDSLYTRGYLMVSRFSPSDGGLRAAGGFDAPASDRGKRAWYDPFSQPLVVPASFDAVDLYTVRPEVEGVPAGQTVTFRLRVQGPGRPVLSAEFPAVQGLVGGITRYRADRPVRFVATATDDAAGTSLPDQTLRVRLGDRVSFQALVAGVPTGNPIDYRISLPPVSGLEIATDDQLTERHAILNWRWHRGAQDVAPAVTADRASEAWAQAAVRFENRLPDSGADASWGAFDVNAVQNVVFLAYQPVGALRQRRSLAPSDGEFRVGVTVGGNRREARVQFSRGARLLDTVERVVREVERVFPNLPVTWFQDAGDLPSQEASVEFVPSEQAARFYIVVGRSEAEIVDERSTSPEAEARREQFSAGQVFKLHHLAGMAAARGDGDPSTIDILVMPDRGLGLTSAGDQVLGKGIGDYIENATLCVQRSATGGCTTVNPLANTVAVYDEHVDTNLNYPAIAPHELGHVFGSGGHPGGGAANQAEKERRYREDRLFRPGAPLLENLMFGAAIDLPSASQQRRLDWNTMYLARFRGSDVRRGLPVLR